ncbi:hypothetical protein GCM10012275_55050 [Longimycelium tulufanense]|uniref:Conjugal transfer protein TraI n=1 Tax=Longimycelium tulufanense TaxID=907463 RepID=A0A8J3CHB9_9PSEU|nr:conjugal transfer protein TraI [Longimycelium tulufanense]GGM77376.1 hypothetical protein GCM10012275_55050 [Longimycelium tulufanense]
MSTLNGADDFGRDVDRGLAELERFLTAQTPPTPAQPGQAPGWTRRVEKLAAEVDEAHLLAELQADPVPLHIDTPKVRKRRQRATEAARLHMLGQDPAARAYHAARVLRCLTGAALVALGLALAWSTAGVQTFAADGAPAWSAEWVFAWFVEPFLSLGLLTVVGAKAYLAIRGRPLTHPTLRRIEWLFLGLTLGMNAFPHLPFVAEPFRFPILVLHLLGPIIAVAIVTALPIIWAAFTALDHGLPQGGDTAGGTGRKYSANGTGRAEVVLAQHRARLARYVARARELIAAGELPANPGAKALRRALEVGTDTARQVRDALKGGAR